MRPVFALVLIAVNAWAEPAGNEPAPAPELPAPGTKGTGAVGVHDVWASGIVITPPAHADAAGWPRGMVMTPPDPRDGNVLALGSLQLPDRAPPAWALPAGRSWPSRLSRGLADGIGSLLDWMNPVGL